MKKTIFRNIAIISAIFILTFSIMLITNYFQVRGVNPLQTEVIETLKQINDANQDNMELKEQIRTLDLLARRAYFVHVDHLMAGVYILLFMLAAFFVSLRFYFAKEKDIPDKNIDPIDEWIIKTNARKYIKWAAGGLVGIAFLFVLMTSPYLKRLTTKQNVEKFAQASSDEFGGGEIIAGEVQTSEAQSSTDSGESLTGNTSEANDGGVSSGADGETGAATSDGAGDTAGSATDTPATGGTSNEPGGLSNTPVAGNASGVADVPKIAHNGFRGNNSNGISGAQGIPTKWDLASGDNIEWKSEIPKHGYNSPVISGNKVFITGADEQSRDLYCYELVSGNLLWTLAATNIPGSPLQMPKTTEDTGLAASTVATNGKLVCAIFASGDLICSDMDGNRVWAKNLGVPENHYGYASSLLVLGNSLIIQYDNTNSAQLVSLDIATGNERWKRTRTDKITWSSPIIAYVNNNPQIVLMGNPGITAYNPSNGDQYWRVEGLTGEVCSSPCSAAGIVFGASEYAHLIAIDAASGTELWRKNDFLPEISSPVATRDNVYMATSYGVLACYDAKTGEVKHFHELDGEFYSSPIIVEGKLYVFSRTGDVFIYSADNDFKQLNTFSTGELTYASPAFTDGRIVVRTNNVLYCVKNK